MGQMNPEAVMKNIIPVVMAGVIGTLLFAMLLLLLLLHVFGTHENILQASTV